MRSGGGGGEAGRAGAPRQPTGAPRTAPLSPTREAKERKKREKMGWGEEYMGYTNTDNPFGDNNLLGTFIWNKALEKKGIGHLEEKELKERNKRIQEDNRLELQKVKQLRLEREREKAMREQELEMLQREKEAEHFKTWEEQEDNFHLQQAKLRAEDDDLAVEMHEPYTFLNGLTVADMEDLLEDIQVYMELEQGKNADFWRDMTIITEDEIAKLRKLEASGKGPGERREGVNASVSSDVQSVFKGKTYSQLQVIFQGIEGKIRAGGPNLDMGYWESLLQQLRAHMARARLRERHQDVLRQKLYKLKQEQGSLDDYDAGKYSPRLLTAHELPLDAHTHYDFDNPPPKIVQGYKFNIFYPDLIDKRSTPEYFLEACADNKDFATLRFHAGPPYEDIAFKIVNREWEYSHRHGFRCQFANGIFQLWFHFKRYRYRR
ncbi:hypothetical protein E2I00_002125 [Balaenoptera physalus]|uniref:Splicing factor Cactin n=1 Tax=Balaenoptera physalus TaxID=9770 RepID=A0A643BW61_BALPH|nr:hypothetical protein E2I00_002125 [Balaenoptera physalus]